MCTELMTTVDGLPLTLVTAIQLWADARTDPSSSRRRDLIRDKTSAVKAVIGDGNRCYYHAHRHVLPFGKMHLAAWDEVLVLWVPTGQQAVLDLCCPQWHAWVYGGAART